VFRSIRTSVALSCALLALLLGVQPAAAAVIINETGRVGSYQLNDFQVGQRGANCTYESNSFDLDNISVRAPFVHGDYQQMTWVGWEFRIQRDAPPFDGAFGTIFKSAIEKSRANDEFIADFSRRKWIAPENPTGQYRVLIKIYWYEPGSKTAAEGRTLARYEWYKAKHDADTYVNMDLCLPHY